MVKDPEFYTKTMAKVYADQGHFEQAAKIYRHLLDKEPGRTDLRSALSEIEMILAESAAKEKKDLVPLFKEWIELLLKYDGVRKLKRLKARNLTGR